MSINAWSSPTLLSEVIVMRKATFHDRNCNWHLSIGSNGGPISLVRTMFKFHTGAGGNLGGITLFNPSIKA